MLQLQKWIATLTVLNLLLPVLMFPANAVTYRENLSVQVETEEEESFDLSLENVKEENDPDEDDNEESLEISSSSVRPQKAANKVPLLLQTDYTDVPYGSGTVATSGCSMVSIAMVASYLRGEEIHPDQLADMFRHADGSHTQRMEAAATVLDLEYTKTGVIGDVLGALNQDKVAIIMVGAQSDFTTTQHYLVLTGIGPDGRIYVNDSNGANYKKKELKDGFENGFSQERVFRAFGGGWIFEGYQPPLTGQSQYGDLKLSQEETDMLAKLIWREARGESFRGQQAVAEVVLNRMVSERFPTKDAINTIMAKDQFRTAKFMKETTADPLQYKAIERALNGPNVLPLDVYFFARCAEPGVQIWGRIDNHVFWK